MPGLTARRPRWRSVYCCDLHRQRRARADQRHLAAQHVHQVRQLIERGASQQRAHARDARVVRVDREAGPDVLRAVDHRAQLQHVELATVQAAAALAVDHRPGGLQADRERREREQRRAQRERERGHDDVDRRGGSRRGFSQRAHASASPRALRRLPRRLGPVAQPVPQAGGERGGGQHVVARDQQRAHGQQLPRARRRAAARAAARA